MAIPTLTPGFTILSTCDANTGWSAGTVDTEVVKQGTSSLSGILRTNGLNTRTFTTTSFNATGQHLRLWLNYASLGFLNTMANGGIQLFAQDTGGALGAWYLGGIDTYDGGWVLLQVDMDTAFDTGTANRTIINRVGFRLGLVGAPRNSTNTWYDYLVRGNGLTITGGTSGDPINWAGVASEDALGGYGAVRRVNGVYFVNTNLVIGGAGTTYFEDSNQIVVFEDMPVDPDLYKLEPLGAGTTTFNLTDSVVKSASTLTRFDLLLNNANLNALSFNGNTIVNADQVRFKTGQTVTGSVFQACNQIQTGGASFTNNTIRNSTDTNGALLWPGGTSVQDCSFIGNTRAIHHDTAGTYTYTNLLFSTNTHDINNTSGGSVTINASGTSNPSTFLGTVTINNSKNFSFSVVNSAATPITGYEWRLYVKDVTQGIIGTTELAGEETATLSSQTYSYNYSGDQNVMLQIIATGYEEFLNQYLLGASDQTVSVRLSDENNI